MTVLADHEICAIAGAIDPFRTERVQPSSYDVSLGRVFRVCDAHKVKYVDLDDPSTFADLTHRVEVEEDGDFVIHPGEAVLAQTEEVIRVPDHLVARIEGKSSLGRLFLIIHMAGYIDPGFEGVITLEMANFLGVPIVMRPGRPIAQLSFSRMSGVPDHPYRGRYQGDRETTASRYGQ